MNKDDFIKLIENLSIYKIKDFEIIYRDYDNLEDETKKIRFYED